MATPYTYVTRYEKDIIKATKEFAQVNNIPFSKMTELMILNTIRTVKSDYQKGRLQIISKAKSLHKLKNPINP
jgi:hypothetical protein